MVGVDQLLLQEEGNVINIPHVELSAVVCTLKTRKLKECKMVLSEGCREM